MDKAHYDIYKRVIAEIEHELGTEAQGFIKLNRIANSIKELRDYEKSLQAPTI